jgi:transposase-like protein
MPWKECSVMEERLRFVARLLEGEAMTELCREFGISRKTGYKIYNRYKEFGCNALTDCSRRPVRYANQILQQIESLIVGLKSNKPYWAPARSANSWSAGCSATLRCRQGHHPRRAQSPWHDQPPPPAPSLCPSMS